LTAPLTLQGLPTVGRRLSPDQEHSDMATIREIEARIRTVKNIEKITQAMKRVAAARLHKAQQRVQGARPYAELMQQVMQRLSRAEGEVEHPLLAVREERNIAVIVMTSDRGLCGSYNSNILRKTMELLRPRDPATVKLVLMGRKGAGFFRRHRYPIALQLPLDASNVSLADVEPPVRTVRSLFETAEVDAVYLVYSRFVNPMSQVATILPLLPLKPSEPDLSPGPSPARGGAGGEVQNEVILFEPAVDQILARLLPRYVHTQVYRALVEAVASEHGARMTSMAAASDNAKDMIDRLSIVRNRVRQAAITKEIAEIVGGAEALK
jgi:F-type H+-transporting ATPase subunit gamma